MDAGTLVRQLDCGHYHSQLDFCMDGGVFKGGAWAAPKSLMSGEVSNSIQQSCMQKLVIVT